MRTNGTFRLFLYVHISYAPEMIFSSPLRKLLPFALLLSIFLSISIPLEATPILLKPNRDLRELYNYNPEFTQNIPTFDSQNRPYIRSRGLDLDATEFIHTLRDEEWVKRPFLPEIQRQYPTFRRTWRGAGWIDPRIVFDNEDRLYTLVQIELEDGRRPSLLLYSQDFGKTFDLIELPPGAVLAEHQSGQNEVEGPPFLLIAEKTKAHPATYASYHRLSVVKPRWEKDHIRIPTPVVVSENLVALDQHSGNSSFAVTRNGLTHFVWAEVTETNEPKGTPFYVTTYDHETDTVAEPHLLTRQLPANNAHNMPGIVIDSEGFLHVVTGSHGLSFYYLRSLVSDSVHDGWTDSVAVLERPEGEHRAGQSYVALACDEQNTLHLVFRHWQTNPKRFAHLSSQGGKFVGALSYQRKPKGKPWSVPTTLVIPARVGYAIYYHRIFLDQSDRLYVSLSYYDRELLGRSSQERYHQRMLLVSPDHGETFHLVEKFPGEL